MEGLKFRGRPPILIARSLKDVVSLKNEYARTIMDRKQPIDEGFINAIIAQSLMSWEGRRPAPALDEGGNFQCAVTDLDLFSFLLYSPKINSGNNLGKNPSLLFTISQLDT